MVGGGIFSILGISVEQIGYSTPLAILFGGILAFLAAFSYVKLAALYKDEGATYSFFKKTFPGSPVSASAIGWLIVFGYISTIALYAFTFSSYFCSQFLPTAPPVAQKLVAGGIILVFAVINIVSVQGMGKVEDWLVYTKIVVLLIISGLLTKRGDFGHFGGEFMSDLNMSSVFSVAAITFVAYEGFQLVIHAYRESDNPDRNVPRAIYSAITIAILLYVGLSICALVTIPKENIIRDKEFALAAGAKQFLGNAGLFAVIFGALLATSSAISGTIFGASRLMAVIATDGHLPKWLSHRVKEHIPNHAIITMSVLSFVLILSGGLQLILEFGSITFIMVSFLMAYANFRVRKQTKTSWVMAILAMALLLTAGILILLFEYQSKPAQLAVILALYVLLVMGAYWYTKRYSVK